MRGFSLFACSVFLLIGFSLCCAETEKKEPPSDWFQLNSVSVDAFEGKYQLRILVGVRNENPKEVMFVYTSEFRSHIGSGGLKFRVPKEYGGDVTVTIPTMLSKGSACFILKNDGSTGQWILDRQNFRARGEFRAEIIRLAVKE